MKKITAILLAAVMVCSMTACGSKKSDETTTASETGTIEAAETSGQEDAEAEPEYFSAFDLEDLSQYIVLGEYKGIEVAAQDLTVTDEEVETELQSQVENAVPIYEEIEEGTVKEGDVVNIDYVGKMDGVPFEGGTDTDFNLTIGSGQFIDGFEDGLIGKNIGDTVDLDLTFPDPYSPNPDYSGKASVFTVTINYVQGEELVQELNDEFVQRVSDECKTVDEYREYVRKDLEASKAATAENTIINEAWEKAMANATYPNEAEKLITFIHDDQLYQLRSSLSMYGMNMQDYLDTMGITEEQMESDLMEYAKGYAKSQLLICAIVKAENMEMTEEEYQSELEALAESVGTTADSLLSAYPGQMLKDVIYQTKVQNLVKESVIEVEGLESETEETTAAE